MSALLKLIPLVQALNLPPSSAASGLFDQALDALLLAEGPPVSPLKGFSDRVRTAIARSPKGRPLFLVHRWQTGPWVCLRLDLAPVPLGRPLFIKDPTTGYHRIATDYRSVKLQKRITAACQALKLAPPPEHSRLSLCFAKDAILIAWTADSSTPHYLEGDLDNYTKNVMDALQRAQIIRNDRHVASFTAARIELPEAKSSLDDFLLEQFRASLKAHPKTSLKKRAAKLGISVRAAGRFLKMIQNLDTQTIQETAAGVSPDTPPPPAAVSPAFTILPAPGSPAPSPAQASPTTLSPEAAIAIAFATAPAAAAERRISRIRRGRGNSRSRKKTFVLRDSPVFAPAMS